MERDIGVNVDSDIGVVGIFGVFGVDDSMIRTTE